MHSLLYQKYIMYHQFALLLADELALSLLFLIFLVKPITNKNMLFTHYSLTYVYTIIVKTCMLGVVTIVYIMTAAAINDKLAQFLREGQNWEKKPTNI
jgi:hypothetical protein